MPTSEQDFLAAIDRHFPNQAEGVLLGRGDDCAILDAIGPLCVSTDLFVEGAHFRRSYFTPADIGHKALAAAASDLAAMGAAPVACALSLVLPDSVDDAFLDELLAGMAALSTRLGLPLAGGDLSRGPALILDLAVFGRPSPAGVLLRRGTLRPGDELVLIGEAGLARAGLLALEASGRAACEAFPAATAAHLRPEPRLDNGQLLAGLPGVRALMDVSDGLARDIPRLLGLGTAKAKGGSKNLGADLRIDEALPHPEALTYFRSQGLDPLEAFVLGGEDYALLAGVQPSGLALVLAAFPAARHIGTVSATPGLRVNGAAFSHAGFDHFAKE
ncbi:MAG: thiamine-phosphate kinase [Proteobacteria bacterium]|nr:thiamine-phosphate kinase [Pseudomonadota bacterium]